MRANVHDGHKPEKNVHDGHRERLTKTVFEVGLESLSAVQQVEYMLFYIFPRGDVNPLAHRLLDHFGSMANIIDADVRDLAKIKGMGMTSAMKVKNLKPMFIVYTTHKKTVKASVKTMNELMDAFEDLLRYSDTEETIVMAINRVGECTGVRRLAMGDNRSVGVEVKKLYSFIDTFKADSIVVAHNHPGGKCTPSINDLPTYRQLVTVIETYGCILLDSFVVGVDGIYSLKTNQTVRKYGDATTYRAVMSMLTNDV